jgi:hypothetical protein
MDHARLINYIKTLPENERNAYVKYIMMLGDVFKKCDFSKKKSPQELLRKQIEAERLEAIQRRDQDELLKILYTPFDI